jgi:hypothetical protein
MTHVFISYCREDIAYANELKQFLEDNNIETWMDNHLRGGENWKDIIDNSLDNSYAVVVIVTEASLNSPWVTYEWARAMGRNIAVFPVTPFEQKEERLNELSNSPLGTLQLTFGISNLSADAIERLKYDTDLTKYMVRDLFKSLHFVWLAYFELYVLQQHWDHLKNLLMSEVSHVIVRLHQKVSNLIESEISRWQITYHTLMSRRLRDASQNAIKLLELVKANALEPYFNVSYG